MGFFSELDLRLRDCGTPKEARRIEVEFVAERANSPEVVGWYACALDGEVIDRLSIRCFGPPPNDPIRDLGAELTDRDETFWREPPDLNLSGRSVGPTRCGSLPPGHFQLCSAWLSSPTFTPSRTLR